MPIITVNFVHNDINTFCELIGRACGRYNNMMHGGITVYTTDYQGGGQDVIHVCLFVCLFVCFLRY